MPEAYVLLNCEIGSEGQIIEAIKGLDIVKEVRGVFGSYDVLARLESPRAEDLNETITAKIRKLQKVNGTLTLLTVEGQG